jgi:hypothetical protein
MKYLDLCYDAINTKTSKKQKNEEGKEKVGRLDTNGVCELTF